MKGAQHGLTILEVMISLILVSFVSLVPVLFLIPASQTDSDSRQRTLAIRAAETWLDRYRANQEAIISRPGCVVAGTTMTCTYAKNATYSTPELTSIMSPFEHVVTVTSGAAGTNVREWTVTAKTSWTMSTGKSKQSVRLSTRMAY